MGVIGCGLSTSITYISNFTLTTVLISFKKEIKDAWFLPNRNSFKGLWEYLKVGIPSAFLLCFDMWCFEIMTLMAGMISV